jgi:hypothetical protein
MRDTKKDKKVHSRNTDDPIEDQLCDSTAYGEIMSSVFGWISSEEQEAKAKELNNLTKKPKRKQKKDSGK